MGMRYQAILKWLGADYKCLDVANYDQERIISIAKSCDGAIIATPTYTHIDYLRALLPSRIKILCEKPITKNIEELEDLYLWCAEHNYDYKMMYQYKEIACSYFTEAPSHYSYFRHGNDGLVWDCLQIIGLANGPVILDERSPVWSCMINGHELSLSNMDWAYVLAVKKWLDGEIDQTQDEILRIHRKAAEMVKELK